MITETKNKMIATVKMSFAISMEMTATPPKPKTPAINATIRKVRAQPNMKSQRWLHNFGRCEEWNLCLIARTVVPANQERR